MQYMFERYLSNIWTVVGVSDWHKYTHCVETILNDGIWNGELAAMRLFTAMWNMMQPPDTWGVEGMGFSRDAIKTIQYFLTAQLSVKVKKTVFEACYVFDRTLNTEIRNIQWSPC